MAVAEVQVLEEAQRVPGAILGARLQGQSADQCLGLQPDHRLTRQQRQEKEASFHYSLKT